MVSRQVSRLDGICLAISVYDRTSSCRSVRGRFDVPRSAWNSVAIVSLLRRNNLPNRAGVKKIISDKLAQLQWAATLNPTPPGLDEWWALELQVVKIEGPPIEMIGGPASFSPRPNLEVPVMSNEITPFHFDEGQANWESLGKKNGITHWRETDLAKALGYQTASAFRNVITRAMQVCLSAKIQCEDHFVLNDGEYLLTRFACYLVAMNGDPKKPQVAAAQVYFATVAETLQHHLEVTEGIDRIIIREKITDGEKSLASTAKRHGVEIYAYFQNAGYRGMYNMDLSRLKSLKGVGDKESLLDRMGKEEAAAHLFRITQTDAKITNEGIRGQKPLERAAYIVGQLVRRNMEEISGAIPEHLPIAEDIGAVKKTLKGTSRKLGEIDKKKK